MVVKYGEASEKVLFTENWLLRVVKYGDDFQMVFFMKNGHSVGWNTAKSFKIPAFNSFFIKRGSEIWRNFCLMLGCKVKYDKYIIFSWNILSKHKLNKKMQLVA